VNVCFYRVSAENNQGRPTCQVYIETKGVQTTFLESRWYEKTLETNQRRNGPRSRAAAQGVGAGAQATEPIRGNLMDPASTAFEDE
jgi:hypothetical protein